MFKSVTLGKSHLKKLAQKHHRIFILTCTKFGNISQASVPCKKAKISQYSKRGRGGN